MKSASRRRNTAAKRAKAFALAWLAFCTAAARAETPATRDTSEVTMPTLAVSIDHFFKAYTLDAYKQFGRRDKQWDEAAEKLLRAFAMARTGDWVPEARFSPYRDAPPVVIDDLVEAVERTGCDDPLVLALCSAWTWETDSAYGNPKPDRVAKVDRLIHSTYPPEAALLVLIVAAGNSDHGVSISWEEKGTSPALQERLRAGIKPLLEKERYKGFDRRSAVKLIEQAMAFLPYQDRVALTADPEAAAAQDPWVREMVFGLARMSWARSVAVDFVSEVPEVIEQRKKKYASLAQESADAFARAYDLEPGFPESAARLIWGASEKKVKQTPREWFDRSVKAQFDFAPAYDRYYRHLVSTHGPVSPEVTDFAVECMATRRYDTSVPWFGVEIFQEAFLAAGSTAEALKKPVFREQLIETFKAYGQTFAPGPDRELCRSAAVALLWRLARFDEARRVFDTLGATGLDPQALTIADTRPGRIEGSLFALTGEYKAELQQAEAAGARGDFVTARDAYAQLPDPKNEIEKRFVRSRRQELAWLVDFEGGDWVDLKPDVATWDVVQGPAAALEVAPDGTLVLKATPANPSVMVVCPASFGVNYDIEADIVVSSEKPGSGMINAGFIVPFGSTRHFFGTLIEMSDGKLRNVRFFEDKPGAAEVVEGESRLTAPKRIGLRVRGQNVELYFPLSKLEPLVRDAERPLAKDGVPGFCLDARFNSATMSVSNIQVRKQAD